MTTYVPDPPRTAEQVIEAVAGLVVEGLDINAFPSGGRYEGCRSWIVTAGAGCVHMVEPRGSSTVEFLTYLPMYDHAD